MQQLLTFLSLAVCLSLSYAWFPRFNAPSRDRPISQFARQETPEEAYHEYAPQSELSPAFWQRQLAMLEELSVPHPQTYEQHLYNNLLQRQMDGTRKKLEESEYIFGINAYPKLVTTEPSTVAGIYPTQPTGGAGGLV